MLRWRTVLDALTRSASPSQQPTTPTPSCLHDVIGLADVLISTTGEPTRLLRDAAQAARAVLSADSLSIRRFDEAPAEVSPIVQEFPELEPADAVEGPSGPWTLTTRLHLAGVAWGELRAAREPSRRPFDDADAEMAEAIARLISAGLVQAAAWRRLETLAWSDGLTGLANRRAFDDRLTAALSPLSATSAAEPAAALGVVVADVNGLKEINDRQGHEAGDAVLRMVARHARAVTDDVADGLAARLGGDEFALLLPGLGARRAYRLADRWCRLVADETASVSLACGFATYRADQRLRAGQPDVAQVRADLVRAADAAAYRAKRLGSSHPERAADT